MTELYGVVKEIVKEGKERDPELDALRIWNPGSGREKYGDVKFGDRVVVL